MLITKLQRTAHWRHGQPSPHVRQSDVLTDRGALIGQIVDCTARQAALEVGLVSYVLQDASVLDGVRTLSLSPSAVVLLGIVRAYPAAARMALLPTTRIALRFARHCAHHDDEPQWLHILYCTSAAKVRDVLRLAHKVTDLRSAELAAVGSPASLLNMLAAHNRAWPVAA